MEGEESQMGYLACATVTVEVVILALVEMDYITMVTMVDTDNVRPHTLWALVTGVVTMLTPAPLVSRSAYLWIIVTVL